MGKFFRSKWFDTLVIVFMAAFIMAISMGFTREAKTRVTRCFSGADTTLNNSSAWSDVFDVRDDVGIFSVAYAFAASSHTDASLDVDLWMSPDGTNCWSRSSDAYSVISGATEASGTDSNGKDCVKFEPTVCGFYKLKFTETATQNAVFSAWVIRR